MMTVNILAYFCGFWRSVFWLVRCFGECLFFSTRVIVGKFLCVEWARNYRLFQHIQLNHFSMHSILVLMCFENRYACPNFAHSTRNWFYMKSIFIFRSIFNAIIFSNKKLFRFKIYLYIYILTELSFKIFNWLIFNERNGSLQFFTNIFLNPHRNWWSNTLASYEKGAYRCINQTRNVMHSK
jgi:hypothetical protein